MATQNNSIQTKNAFFFSHDSNARNDEKIINARMEHGESGYAIYFMLVEMLVESTHYMLTTNYKALAFNLRVNEEVLQSVVEDFELFDFTEDQKFFFSPSLNRRVEPLEQLREKRRKAALLGVEARRKKQIEAQKEAKKEAKEARDAQKEEQKTTSQVSDDHLLSRGSTNASKNSAEKSRVEQRKAEKTRAEKSKVEQNAWKLLTHLRRQKLAALCHLHISNWSLIVLKISTI